MKFTVSRVAITLALALGTSHPAVAVAELPTSVTRDSSFLAWLESLADAIKRDPGYERIPLDTEAQTNRFSTILHRLYRGEISEAQFRIWVDVEYPGHEYEQTFIIQHLPRNGQGNK